MRSERCTEGKDRVRPQEYIIKSGQKTHMTWDVFKGSLFLCEQNVRDQLGSRGLHLGSHAVIPAENDDDLGRDVRTGGVER